VVSLYYGATTLKRVITIAENNARSAETHRAATEARVAAGALPMIALKRAQFDLVQAEQTVRSARSSYALLLGSLGQLIGIDTMFDIVPPSEVKAVEAEGDVEKYYDRAMQSRRDLKAAKVSLQMAERGMTDYWMRYLPSLNAVGQGNWTSNKSGFQKDPVTYNVVLSAAMPLYDGGERYSARDDAASKIRQAKLSIEKIEAQTESLIRGNLQDIDVRLEGLQASQLAVELARENHRNAEALFDVGAATNIEVIDANSAQFAAEIDLARAELEVRLARLGLLFVVGEYPSLDEKQSSPFLYQPQSTSLSPDASAPASSSSQPAATPTQP
jgi:outer membrane protein